MSFSSFSEFIQMGEHGLFVWSCYGLTLVVLVMNILRPLQLQRRLIQEKRRAMAQEDALSQAPGSNQQVDK
ncbi:heme exporter protein CcmD [Pseudomonadales bacterium]|nr:heme exporter protein CcmD [Pseudomonadales bacterium]MDB9867117.1 heme exporter protein CcmD [Pseudomonadales bacterium]MDB9879516.1 heme exporter protein CcmD [Pseudomonadales bacterium]MDC0013842.1 heme exporter protein CcmD [Pseudomonadales bacterium]MDC1306940.1 heme exporter protein CcmD [Pseudomonadales bacterium]|tara:strand:+ start:512 stop:724 length:213 start_codon:yes stop_codon:yes gene_type:complete